MTRPRWLVPAGIVVNSSVAVLHGDAARGGAVRFGAMRYGVTRAIVTEVLVWHSRT